MTTTSTTKHDQRLFCCFGGTRVLFPTPETCEEFSRMYYRAWRAIVTADLPEAIHSLVDAWGAEDKYAAIPLAGIATSCKRRAEEGMRPYELAEYAQEQFRDSVKDHISDMHRKACTAKATPSTPLPRKEGETRRELPPDLEASYRAIMEGLRKYGSLAFARAYPDYLLLIGDLQKPEILADPKNPTVIERRSGDRGKVTCSACGKPTSAARLTCRHCKQPIG